MKYYEVDGILAKKDLHGNTPEILISTGNRSAGKTVAWNHFVMEEFLNKGHKFILLVRYVYELDNIGTRFFADLHNIYYPDILVTSKHMVANTFAQITMERNEEKQVIGYCIPLNKAETIKKYSHVFNDVENILFDEFQNESSQYLTDEVNKFISIHHSVARGKGKQSRFVRTILVGNRLDLLCPYLIELGISQRLKKDTKYLRGNGFIYEQLLNIEAQNAQKDSIFNQAFNNDYMERTLQSQYLDENCYCKLKGANNYFCSLKHKNKKYSIRYVKEGVHVAVNCDESYPYKFACTPKDIGEEYIYIGNSELKANLKTNFNYGLFTFENAEAKEALLNFLK